MAKIATQIVAIKISKMVKDTDKDVHSSVDESQVDDLVAILQELIGDKFIVESVDLEDK